MKIFFTICIITTAMTGFSQNPETPLIVTKVKMGDTLPLKGYDICLNEVIEDSRCPSDVTCMWEGQAKVKVLISNNGNIEEKEIVFKGKNTGNEKEQLIYSDENYAFIAYQLLPYPVSTDLGKRDYELVIYERLNNTK